MPGAIRRKIAIDSASLHSGVAYQLALNIDPLILDEFCDFDELATNAAGAISVKMVQRHASEKNLA